MPTFAFLEFSEQLCFKLHSFLITDFVLVLLTQGDRCCRIRSPGSDTSPFLPLTVSLSLSPSLFPFSPRQSKTSCSPAWPNLERVSAIPVDRVKQLFCADLGSAEFIPILTLYTLREATRLITKQFQANLKSPSWISRCSQCLSVTLRRTKQTLVFIALYSVYWLIW